MTGINKRKADPIIASSFDIHCEIQAVPFALLSQMQPGEPSSVIRERVLKARQIQEHRFQGQKGIHCNAQMTERMIHQYAEPDEASLDLLRMAMERLKLSARAYSRILIHHGRKHGQAREVLADQRGCDPNREESERREGWVPQELRLHEQRWR